ncbi:lipopolysaccharide biosynthesis protein [Weissella cibaria]|uniref:lipopolysaccharide biosynthesis protein n=1 Tax=Weissella cibaria TaxID=137591 RepID=UPI0021BF0961|nr:oligosaccharide flippase family protein [Weissella cibaria]
MHQRQIGAILAYINIFMKNLVNFIYIPLLLRFVGGENYGLYQMTNQVVGALSLLAMGLSASYIRFFWKTKKSDGDVGVAKLNGIYLSYFIFIGVISLLVGGVLTINIDELFNQTFTIDQLKTMRVLMIILVINISITFISSIFDSYIVANERYIVEQSRLLLSTLVQPIGTVLLLFLGFGVIGISIIQLITTVVFIIWNIIYAFKKLEMKIEFIHLRDTLTKGREIFAFSGFILLNQVVDTINNNFSSVMVGSIVGPMGVAIFAVANQIKNMFYQITFTISRMYVSKINRMVSSDATNEELTTIMIKIGRMQLFLLSTVFGLFVLIGKMFIDLWAGHNYGEAYWIVIIMMVPLIVPLSQNIGLEIQKAKNLHKFRIMLMCVSAIFNLVISYFAIKKTGVLGASLGFSISTLIVNVIIVNVYNHNIVKLDMVRYWRETGGVIIGPLTGLVVATVLHNIVPMQTEIIKTVLSVILYGFLVLLLQWYVTGTTSEKKTLKKMVKGISMRKPRHKIGVGS